MKEITAIITIQVTVIDKLKDKEIEEVFSSTEKIKDAVTTHFKNEGADDVTVTIQDFVRDLEAGEGNED